MLLGNGLAAGCNCPWVKVWGACWKAMTNSSSKRAGRRDKVFWLLFCLWFTLSCGPEKCSLRDLLAFFSNSFFPSMENTSKWCFPGHPVICLHCTKLRSLAVVWALASSQQCSCVLVQVAGDPDPKAYEKLLWRSLLCSDGWACCFSFTFKSLLLISLV